MRRFGSECDVVSVPATVERFSNMRSLCKGTLIAMGTLSSLLACGGSTSSGSPQGISCIADGVCQPQCAADPDCASGGGGIAGMGGATSGTQPALPTGGTSGIPTGGNSGTGGTSLCQPTRASGSYPVIDNMADGDSAIISQDGRSGGWGSFNDGTGTQTPTVPLVAASVGKICTSGFGFTSWGAGLVAGLNSDGTNSCTYDGSIYKGISFSIEGIVSGSAALFSVATTDIRRVSDGMGGTCVETGTSVGCNDFYGAQLVGTTAGITCKTKVSSWTCGPVISTSGPIAVTIPFANMSQAGFGRVFPNFDTTKMQDLQWNFVPTATTNSFNLCISNLSFY